MKKYVAIITAIIIVICCCGCFGGGNSSSSNDVHGQISGGNNYQSAATDPIEQTAPQFSLGTATGTTYRNDYLGLSCTVPSDWVFYTEQEILAMNNITSSYLDEAAAEAINNATIIYDMVASNPNGCSINVNLEKLTALQALSVNVKTVLESQIDAIVSSYENMGYTNINVTSQSVIVDGNVYDGLVITANIQGLDFYATNFSFVEGTYLANVCISSLQTDAANEILSYFTID